MITVKIPGRDAMEISHIVLDYNGTIAVDGQLIPGAEERIRRLAEVAEIHVLTADTYGTVRDACSHLPLVIHTFPHDGAGPCKLEIVQGLAGGTACFGNGFNDIPMFGEATLAVAVMEEEGVCASLLPHADVFVPGISAGLDLLLETNRLRATLRN